VTIQDEELAAIDKPAGAGRTLLASAIGLVYFSPVIWMVLAAFKTRADALATPPKLFFTPTLEHFWASFHRISADGTRVMDTGLVKNFANSLVISLVSVSLALALGALAAYGFSRLRIAGRSYFMFYILVLRMVPPITAIIPLYFLFRVTGLGGSYVAIILVYTAFNLPFAIWMLKSFLDELHRPIEEAARLDGSSELTILWRICLPQIQAGIAATAIIAFVFTWNDFLFSLLLTSVDTRTVPVAMTRVVGADVGVDWGVFASIGTIYLAPILLVAFFLQSQLLRGATFGTVPR
jgi:multiple sugar transport system permease protein